MDWTGCNERVLKWVESVVIVGVNAEVCTYNCT